MLGLLAILLTLANVTLSDVALAKEERSLKGTLSKSIELSKEDKVVKQLFGESFKVMGIGLSKGQKLEKHQTPTPAFLYVHSGKVTFLMKGEKTILNAGDYFSIPPKEMHEVESQEDSLLLLMK